MPSVISRGSSVGDRRVRGVLERVGSAATAVGERLRPAPPAPGCGRCAMPEARVIPIRPDDDDPSSRPCPTGMGGAPRRRPDFLRRRATGEYETDEFGFDPDLTDHALLPLLRPFFQKWFRVESQGLENVPSVGGALVVANHSGTVPVDALMTTVALHDDHPPSAASGCSAPTSSSTCPSSGRWRASSGPPWPATRTPSGC